MTMCEPWTILFQLYPVHELKTECKSAYAFKGFEEHSYLLLRLKELPELPLFIFPHFHTALYFISTDTKNS